MELLTVSKSINEKIQELERFKKELSVVAEKKALSEAKYEKQIAITIASMINGKDFTIDGQLVKNPPNAMLDKIAKGICSQEKLIMDLASDQYRNLIKIIELTEAQLNGLQSINRHLSET